MEDTNLNVFNKILTQHQEKLRIKIKGKSMQPLLKDGKEVELCKIDSVEELKRFDILVFYDKVEDIFICHYFWKLGKHFVKDENDYILTRPLNPLTGYDTPVNPEMILGRVKNESFPLWLKMYVFMGNVFLRSR